MLRDKKSFIVLKNNATKREVLHEIGHALTHRHLGDAAYNKLSKEIREHLASTFVRSRDAFRKMTPEEVWQELKSIDPDFVPSEAIKALLKKWGVMN